MAAWFILIKTKGWDKIDSQIRNLAWLDWLDIAGLFPLLLDIVSLRSHSNYEEEQEPSQARSIPPAGSLHSMVSLLASKCKWKMQFCLYPRNHLSIPWELHMHRSLWIPWMGWVGAEGFWWCQCYLTQISNVHMSRHRWHCLSALLGHGRSCRLSGSRSYHWGWGCFVSQHPKSVL